MGVPVTAQRMVLLRCDTARALKVRGERISCAILISIVTDRWHFKYADLRLE